MFDRSLARFGGRGQGSSLRHSVTTGDVDDGFRESRRRRLLLIRHRSMRLAGQDAQRYRPARHRSGFFLYNPLEKSEATLEKKTGLFKQVINFALIRSSTLKIKSFINFYFRNGAEINMDRQNNDKEG